MSVDTRWHVSITLVILLIGQLPTATSTISMNESRYDQIIWETIALPEYMDPHKNYERMGAWIHSNIYETLVTYDFESADTSPLNMLLAESLVVSSDGHNYTFTLRQGITFHDSTEFNATAVQMNFWRMLGRGWDDGWGPVWMIAQPILGGKAVQDAVYEHGDGSPEHIDAWNDWMANSKAVVVIDEFTVRIRLAYSYAPFLSVLAYSVGSMISPTFFMAHGGMSPESDNDTLDEKSCGTGPYILEDWIQDDRIELSINHNYWRSYVAVYAHPFAGSIETVSVRLNADDPSRMLNLQEGLTDGCYWSTSHAQEVWNNVTEIGDGTLQSSNPSIKVWAGNLKFDVMFLGFNMNPYVNVSGEVRMCPFTNYDLRAAVSYAFDYQAVIDTLLDGWGVQLQGPIPRGLFAHDDELFMFERDMTMAVEHWNIAMTNGLDDIWANNSYELVLYIGVGSTNRNTAALLVKEAIENIIADPISINPSQPLTIEILNAEWPHYLYLVQNHQMPIFFLGWSPDYADPDNYIEPIVRSTSSFPKRVGLEGSAGEGGIVWDNVTINGLIDAAAAESDPTTRELLYSQIQVAIVEHCAYLWCYQTTDFHTESFDVQGFVYNPMRQPYFYHYYKVREIPNPIVIQMAIFGAIIVITLVILLKSFKK
ncbi:MAG: ABC transporter substrate-binding protein [Candidatus Thorarchaeota archaeon]